MKEIKVVAAIIMKNDKILAMQKGKTKYDYTSFKYEFPGGKIENNETPEDALKREIKEELDIDIKIKSFLITVSHNYPDFKINLYSYICECLTCNINLKEHIDYCWCNKEDLSKLNWSKADIGIVEALINSKNNK